jgi:hypothetical protein
MANKNRYRFGLKETAAYAVASDTVIEQGDMLGIDVATGLVYPANDETWDTNLATTQAAFAAKFAGIAMDASPAGSTAPITVALTGVFAMAQASATLALGASVSPAQVGTTEKIASQSVVASTPRIGKAAKCYAAVATEVLIRVRAAQMPASAAAS